jgi:glyoxylase-like metal-dependent hydrolase (beta-lactamase superfamily II)
MSDIPLQRDLVFDYGRVDRLSPLVRRVIARNPSPFTFHGTGTYIIGQGAVAVIDPGPDLPEHVEAILKAIPGETVSHILITHTHADHSPAAAALQAATGAQTYGFGPHPRVDIDDAEAGADHAFTPDQRLSDGDVVSGPTWSLQAIHTPGHLPNHLCFSLPGEQALFTGDHVMGWSTTVIVPPNGHMATYLNSLRLLLDRDDLIYYPTHGAPIANPRAFVRALIGHRLARERNIRSCLENGLDDIGAIVAALYKNVPRHLHAAAAQSVLAHLIHLQEQGIVEARQQQDEKNAYRLIA